MEGDVTKTSGSPSPISVPFILGLALGDAPKRFKNTFQNAFALFTLVLRRQRQLSSTPFNCDIGYIASQKDVDDICDLYGLRREELDPDRIGWVEGDVQRKFFLQPGQWVTICEVGSSVESSKPVSDVAGFTCRILPLTSSTFTRSTSPGNVLRINSVAEFNLRRTLSIPPFRPLPPLRIRPLLSDPLIKAPNKSVSYSPIHGKSLKLGRLTCPQQISSRECDILIRDAFTLNCKYLCVGDIISIPLESSTSRLELIVSEVNDKRQGDESFKEVFKVSQDSSSVSLSSSEISNHFHTKLNDSQISNLMAPCQQTYFMKLCGWIRQTLCSLNDNTLSSDLWPSFLICGSVGSGKHSLCQAVALSFGLNFHFVNAANLIGDTSAYTEAKLKTVYEKIKNSICPSLVFIKNLQLIGKDKEGHEDKRVVIAFKEFLQDITNLSVSSAGRNANVMFTTVTFIVGSTESPEALVSSVSQNFLFKLQLRSTMKSIEETEKTLRWLLGLSNAKFEDGVELRTWVKRNCEGMQGSYGDLKALVAIAIRNAFTRASECPVDDINGCTLVINQVDLDNGLKAINTAIKKATNKVEVPKVSWKDIGGLEDIKTELINSVKLPLEFPHLFGSGIRRSGILLYGPPGTGKTLIAKAVATEFKLSFFSVKGPELLNMYVGQSEQNVRDVFEKARNAAPCIVFFDELDALAPNRGRAGDSGGVMDRVVSQILAELDATHSTPDVFIIGATNRPDLIDPALLRPGRFDKLVYVGINQNVESKTSVLKALTRKFQLDTVDLAKLAEILPHGMSGADLYSLCSDAYMTAVERQISQLVSTTALDNPVSEGQLRTEAKSSVVVQQCDFEAAISRTSPSLSEGEQARYEALKAMKR